MNCCMYWRRTKVIWSVVVFRRKKVVKQCFVYIMEMKECLYLRLGEVDKAAFLLSEVLWGPLLVLPVALILEHLNLIGAAEIISATGRDVWHGSLEITIQRHHSQLGSPLHTTTGYGNHSWRWHTVTTTNQKKIQTKTNKLRRHYHLTYRGVRKRPIKSTSFGSVTVKNTCNKDNSATLNGKSAH